MNAQIKITYRDTKGNIIENPTVGQRAFSPETQKIYTYTENSWKMLEGDVNLGISIYDLNKQIFSQMPYLNEEGLAKAFETLNNFVNVSNQVYYMLLCRDINYYTIFNIVDESTERFSGVVLECVTDIGAIKSVEGVEGAIEIWVHPADGEPIAMYLFPYDEGVVKCTR